MSRWSDKAKNHPIHETVLQARELVYKEIEDIDSEHEEEQKRLVKILDRIQDLLDGIDPDIFPEGEFNNINSHMRHQNFWNQLTAYSNSGNVQNLKTANDHINAQLPRIFSISGMAKSPEIREEVNSIESAFEEFCKVVEKKKSKVFEDVSSIDGKVKELQGSEKEIRNGFDDLRQKVSVQFDEWANEFASSQANRQNEHAESEVNRRKEFEETLIDIKSRAEDEVKDISKKHDDSLRSVFDGFSEEVKTRSEDIGNKHQSVLDIHELVATDGVAGGYKKNADDEKVSADNWRRISLGCYGIILAWVVLKGVLGFNVYLDGEFQWPVMIMTLSITGVAFVAAQFASRQSRVHRVNEQRMRWFSLEVKAIDPFISSLPTEQQHELKRQLSERLFGQDRVADEKPKGYVDAGAINSLVESLSNLTKRS